MNGPTGSAGEGRSVREEQERAAKFAEKPPLIPRNAIIIALVAFVVLGLGGVVFDHFFGGPVSTTVATAPGTNPPPLETTVPPAKRPRSGELSSSVQALLGLTTLKASPAPDFDLESQESAPISLRSFRGKVVVLSFFDSRCNDICPVVAAELKLARSDLGADGSRVVMLTVNTDPTAVAVADDSPAIDEADISDESGWYFLTGTLKQLDDVWEAYGVTIEVQPTTNLISHNDVIYFVDTNGDLRSRATPFANESSSGSFALPRSTEERFAAGIATTARSLLQVPS